jgi:hypothetical protein
MVFSRRTSGPCRLPSSGPPCCSFCSRFIHRLFIFIHCHNGYGPCWCPGSPILTIGHSCHFHPDLFHLGTLQMRSVLRPRSSTLLLNPIVCPFACNKVFICLRFPLAFRSNSCLLLAPCLRSASSAFIKLNFYRST